MEIGYFWGFEAIRATAAAGDRGRNTATIIAFVVGVTSILLGVAFRAWALALCGVIAAAFAITWFIRRAMAVQTAARMAERPDAPAGPSSAS